MFIDNGISSYTSTRSKDCQAASWKLEDPSSDPRAMARSDRKSNQSSELGYVLVCCCGAGGSGLIEALQEEVFPPATNVPSAARSRRNGRDPTPQPTVTANSVLVQGEQLMAYRRWVTHA